VEAKLVEFSAAAGPNSATGSWSIVTSNNVVLSGQVTVASNTGGPSNCSFYILIFGD
jgi:hypothetical protein